VYQVFDGTGLVRVGTETWPVEQGDLFVVPSWQEVSAETESGLDLFRFSDAPIFEKLDHYRAQPAENAP
jgi:gentisate 1,2-dioxygenase